MNESGNESLFADSTSVYNTHTFFNVARAERNYISLDKYVTASPWNNASLGVMALRSIRSSSLPLSVIQWIGFTLGTFGNILILVVLLWRRISAQLVTQLLVGSLAVANVCMMLGVACIEAILHVDQNWKFGLFYCKVYYFLMGSTVCCSTWILAIVAVDRQVYGNK
jgi:7 transmembrane receptor (rhodopsin family)